MGVAELSRSIGPSPARVNRVKAPFQCEQCEANCRLRGPSQKLGTTATGGRRRVGGLLLPGALPNRAYVRCLGGSSECNVVIVGTCVWPVTAEPYRAKTAPLPRSSILFRPHWWRRRVP